MPTMVQQIVNPAFKPENADEEAAFKAAKAKAPFEVDYVTGMDNVKLSRGMYAIKAIEDVASAPPGPRKLEDYTNDELKLAFMNAGFKTEKQMTRDGMIQSIRTALSRIEVVD